MEFAPNDPDVTVTDATGPAETEGGADTPDTGDSAAVPDAGDVLDVYWRPGCGYCNRLFRVLRSEGVEARMHNIWEDPDARRFVQAHNRGSETVPTVTLGGVTRTNPDPHALVDELRAKHAHLLGAPAAGWNPLRRLRT